MEDILCQDVAQAIVSASANLIRFLSDVMVVSVVITVPGIIATRAICFNYKQIEINMMFDEN